MNLSLNDTKATGADALAQMLAADILHSNLRPGDFYATEQELVERHAVTRGVVREAVSRLRSLGILTGRKNKGLLVVRPDPAFLVEQVCPFLVRTGADLHALAGLRYNLLVGAVDAAVKNATQEQIDQMMLLAKTWGQCVQDDGRFEEGFRIASQINCLLLKMTGNPMIMSMTPAIELFFQVTRWPGGHWPSHILTNSWHYRELAAAVASRDPEMVRSIVRINLGYLINEPVSHWDLVMSKYQQTSKSNV